MSMGKRGGKGREGKEAIPPSDTIVPCPLTAYTIVSWSPWWWISEDECGSARIRLPQIWSESSTIAPCEGLSLRLRKIARWRGNAKGYDNVGRQAHEHRHSRPTRFMKYYKMNKMHAYLSRHALRLSIALLQICCFGHTNGICDPRLRAREEGGVHRHFC